MKSNSLCGFFLAAFPYLFIFFALALPLQASEYETGGAKGDYFVDIAAKLGRGMGNVLASPAELTCGQLDNDASRGFVSLFETGTVGVVKFVRRLAYGVFEIGTFFIPTDKVLSAACG